MEQLNDKKGDSYKSKPTTTTIYNNLKYQNDNILSNFNIKPIKSFK